MPAGTQRVHAVRKVRVRQAGVKAGRKRGEKRDGRRKGGEGRRRIGRSKLRLIEMSREGKARVGRGDMIGAGRG